MTSSRSIVRLSIVMALGCALVVVTGCKHKMQKGGAATMASATTLADCCMPAAAGPSRWATVLAAAPVKAEPVYNDDVKAWVAVPAGWSTEPLKKSTLHSHQVWLSPTRHTAYGIIRFQVPFPVGDDLALWGFLSEMKKVEGKAELLWERIDKELGGRRFEARGNQYQVTVNLVTRGFGSGWCVYVGRLVAYDEDPAEVAAGTTAREATVLDSGK